MRRFGGALFLLAALLAAPPVQADEREDEQARVIESLHAFGVRGLPTAYASAASGALRTESIDLGLAWLAAHQAPDGSWRPKELDWCNGKQRKQGAPSGKGKSLYTTGVTGMVVSAYLGAGYTHRGKHPYAQVVRSALTWLVESQDTEGCVGPRRTQQYVYNHAFGTLALVEAYALSGDPQLRAPAQRAIDFSELARNPYKTWRYGVKPGDNDTSITGCMGLPLYVALRLNRAAKRARLFEPLGLDDTVFDGIRAWIDEIVDPRTGRAGYVLRGTGPARPQEHIDKFPGEKSASCTAITVFLRLALPGFERTPQEKEQSRVLADKGVRLMLGLKPAWTLGGGNIDFYYWYYATMALRQVGGDAWRTWDGALAKALLGSQHREGEVCGVRGSWDPEGVWAKSDGGRIYATAICLLMLQTPDRMRPLPAERTDLLEALATKELAPARRASILRGIGVLKVQGAGADLLAWLDDENAEVAAAAARALGRVDAGPELVRELAQRLDDKRVVVRRAVVDGLRGHPEHLRPAIDRLLGRLTDADVEVAAGAARALGASGVKDVAPLLERRTRKGDIALRVAVASAVWSLTQQPDSLTVCLEGLAAKRASVRIEAAGTIASYQALNDADIGPAVPALEKALEDPVPEVRISAAGVLLRAKKHRAECIDTLVEALDAPRATDRYLAIHVLTDAASPKAVPKLSAQLLTGAGALRIKAAGALEAIGTGARPAAAALSWCSANGPAALRKAASNAYDALDLGPEEAVRFLLPALESARDEREKEGAARGLVFQGAAIVPALTEKLASGTPTEKGWLIDVLGRMGRAAAPATAAIARELKSSTKAKRKAQAARALGAIGPAASKALPQLEAALAHEKAVVRRAALRAIGRIAAGSKQAVGVLVTAASNKDAKRIELRLIALEAMGRLDGDLDAVMPAVFTALMENDWQVNQGASAALEALWPACERHLADALAQPYPHLHDGIARVVVRLGPAAAGLVRPLAKILEAGQFRGEVPYADALAAIGRPAVTALIRLLGSPFAQARMEAARALGLIGPDARRALKPLTQLLHDPELEVQRRAQEAIDRIRNKKR